MSKKIRYPFNLETFKFNIQRFATLQSTSISANGSHGHHKFTMNVYENSIGSSSENNSSMSWELILSPIQKKWGWASWGQKIYADITFNGSTKRVYIPDYDGTSTVTIASGTATVAHSDDGSGSVSFSFSIVDNGNGKNTSGYYYTPGDADEDGSMTLTKIARAPYYNSVSSSSITQTSATLTASITNYGLSITDGGWDLSTDGGSTWTYYSGGVTSKTITGLSPNTKYWYRGYVVTDGGSAHSSWSTFTTESYKAYVKVNGTWKQGIPFIKVNGTWKQGIPYVKVSGSWKTGA